MFWVRRKTVLLCLLALQIAINEAYTPVVYPSLAEGHGFIYHDETDKIMSLPGGLDPLLCSGRNEETSFEAADQECSQVVYFTEGSSMTLQVLNLSSNGVIQGFHSIPEVRTNLSSASISWRMFGSSGPLNSSFVGPVTDEETGDVAELPEESDLDIDDAARAEDSAIAPEAENETETENDDQAMAELLDDLPDLGNTSTIDSIEASVLTANRTAGFLRSDGTLRSDRVLLLELSLNELPESRLLRVTLRFGQGVSRSIYIFRTPDSEPAGIRLVEERESSAHVSDFQYEVQFPEYVFRTPDADQVECEEVREPLEKFNSAYLLNDDRRLEPNDLMAMISASRELRSCSASLDRPFVPRDLVQVTGVSPSFERNRGNLSLRRLRQGRTAQSSVTVFFSVDTRRRTRVQININSNAAMTLAGKQVEGRREMYYIERRSVATQNSIDTGHELGTTSTVITSYSVGTSVTATVGASMAVSAAGTAATGSTASAASGGTVTGAVDLLTCGQRIYLVSQMAVPNMPENFKAFGDSLSWTMLYIKVPWRDNTAEQRRYQVSDQTMVQTTSLDSDDETEVSRDVVVVESEWPYERVVLAFFWTGLFFCGLLLFHCASIALFFTLRWDLPELLRFPRLELFFFYWATPAIAGGCASLLTGNDNAKALGILLLILFPGLFTLWHVYLLVRNFYMKPLEKVNVFYEVKRKDLSRLYSKKFEQIPDADLGDDGGQEQKKKLSVLERFLVSPVLGAPYASGKWKTVDGPSNKFVERFGPAFEDFRHIPGLRKNATFQVSAAEKRVQRGQFGPFRASWDHTRMASVFQVSGTVSKLIVMILIACIILGEEDPKNNNQAVFLLSISIIYLVLLRVFRPYSKRWKLTAAMVEEVMNIITYCIVLYLLHNKDSAEQDIRRRLGFTMIAMEGIGFGLIFLEQILLSWHLIKNTATLIWDRFKKQPQFVKVVMEAQFQNPRYLERKYFNIWVHKTLGKGLYPGVLTRDKNAPIEEQFWAHPAAAIKNIFCRCSCTDDHLATTYSRSRI